MKKITQDEKSSIAYNVKNKCNKKHGETEVQYIYRIYSMKQQGLIDATNDQIGNIINKELYGNNFDLFQDESSYRKQFQAAQKFYDEIFSEMDSDVYLDEIRQAEYELNKTIVKVRDEKTELRKLLREQARKETSMDAIRDALSNIPNVKLSECKKKSGDDNDLIVNLTDIHAGIIIDNYKNKFNDDVLKERLSKYLAKICEIQKRHKSKNCYLVIGEIISGLIHENLRYESDKGVVEQFTLISEYLVEFIKSLSKSFKEVHIYITPGNHSRCVANKSSAFKGENFDHLLRFYLNGRFEDTKRIHIYENKLDESISNFEVRGNVVMASHGDKDSPNDVVQKFALMFKTFPDIILLGHKHTNAMYTQYDTKIVQTGCVSGTDNYALDHRLANNPEQTVLVINEGGIECLYDVQLV